MAWSWVEREVRSIVYCAVYRVIVLLFLLRGSQALRLAQRSEELQKVVKSWSTTVSRTTSRCRRLRLLSSPQLLSLMQACRLATPERVFPFMLLW